MAAKEFLTKIMVGGEVSASLAKALGTSEKLVKSTMGKVAKMGKTMGKVADVTFAAGAAGAAYSVKAAVDYQQSLAKVATLADTSKKSLEQLSKEVIDVSNKTGVASTEINEALYQAISAGADTAHATELVEIAVKSSIGGYTDAATAVDGLTTVLNAYGMQTQDAEKIANQMLITQNLGKTTFGELAKSVGKLSPIMNSAGLKSEEMFASLAALTANGIQTSEAVSGMKAAISNIIKPSGEAQKMAQKLGINFSAAALQSKGLSGFMADLKEKTGGNLDTMSKLFGSVEGLNAVLALTSDSGGALLNKSLAEMGTNTEALNNAFKTMMTPEQKFAILKTKINNAAITIGEKLLPYVEKAVDWATNIDFDKVISSIETFAPIILGIAAALKIMSVTIAIVNAVTAASPVTWIVLGIVAAIIALVAIIVICVKHWDSIKAAALNVWNAIKEAFGNIGAWFKDKFDAVMTAIKPTLDWITEKIEAVKNGWDKVKGFFTSGGETKVKAYATGGTVTRPHLAVVGDAPETIVPHGNTPRNRALLAEAARGVGGGASGGVNITFAPTIYGGNGGNIRQDLRDAETEFESRMDEYFRKRGLVSFA